MTFSGDRADLDPVFNSKRRRTKFNGRQIFSKLDEIDGWVVWGFNAKAVGRMKSGSRKEAVANTNLAIGELVIGPSRGRDRADAPVRLTQYAPDSDDGFLLSAEVRLPNLPATEVGRLVTERMIEMALDLRYVKKVESSVNDRRHLSPAFYRGTSGLQLNIDQGDSSVRVPGDTWQAEASRTHLHGRDVMNGEQPLIYLAGIVALARADELAQG